MNTVFQLQSADISTHEEMKCIFISHRLHNIKGSDTLESFLSKVTFKSNLQKKLSRIEHVLIVKVYFERRKIAKLFMTHVQVFFRKSLALYTTYKDITKYSGRVSLGSGYVALGG